MKIAMLILVVVVNFCTMNAAHSNIMKNLKVFIAQCNGEDYGESSANVDLSIDFINDLYLKIKDRYIKLRIERYKIFKDGSYGLRVFIIVVGNKSYVEIDTQIKLHTDNDAVVGSSCNTELDDGHYYGIAIVG